jgi:hypothetical protein
VRDDLRLDLALHVCAVVGLVVTSWLLVRGLISPLRTTHDTPPIAFVRDMINSARTRPAKIPFWQDAQSGTALHERDQVFTSARSSATVEFVSGQRIQLEENSLVVIELEAQSPALNIRRGIVYIVSGASARGDVAFRVNGVKGLVRSGESKAVVDVARDGTASVYVLSGGATLESASGPVEVIARHVSEVSASGVVAEAEAARVMLESPAWDSEFLLGPDTAVEFSWSLQGQLEDVQLELASDLHFESVFRRVPAAGQSVRVSGLRAGRWYWRVTGSSRGVSYKSDTRQINFGELIPPRILLPMPKELVVVRNGKARVTLDWISPAPKAAAEFELQRVGDGAGRREVAQEPRVIRLARAPHVLVDIFDHIKDSGGGGSGVSGGAGAWQVRARSVFPGGEISGWGVPVSFQIGEEPEPEAPQLVFPPNGARLPFAEVHLRGTGPKVMNLVFEVSRGENFSGEVIRLAEDGLKARFQPPEAGEWWWRASGEDFLGRKLPLSSPRKMELTTRRMLTPPQIRDQEIQLSPPAQPKSDKPAPSGASIEPQRRRWLGDVLNWIFPVAVARESADTSDALQVTSSSVATGRGSDKGAVTVRWPVVEGASGYQLQIAAQQDFAGATIEVDVRTRDASWSWTNARAGLWWYRVAVFDGDDISQFSEPAQLRVLPAAVTPEKVAQRSEPKTEPKTQAPAKTMKDAAVPEVASPSLATSVPPVRPAAPPVGPTSTPAPEVVEQKTESLKPPSKPKPPVSAASLVLMRAGTSWLDTRWNAPSVHRQIEGRLDSSFGVLAQGWWRRTLRASLAASRFGTDVVDLGHLRLEFGPTFEARRNFWLGPIIQGESTWLPGFPRENGRTLIQRNQVGLWRLGIFWHRKAGLWNHSGSLAVGRVMATDRWQRPVKPTPALDLSLFQVVQRRWILGASAAASLLDLDQVLWSEGQEAATLRHLRMDLSIDLGLGF